jgi:outer membrane immunogenic protein
MKRIAPALFAAAALILSVPQSASSADLRPVTKAPPYAAPAPYNWTGFYVGGHFGAGWGTVESSLTAISAAGLGTVPISLPLSSHNVNGFLGGGQVGYNWQANPWLVLGIEGSFTGTGIEGTGPCVVGLFSCKTEVNWMADVTGRVGVTVGDRALVYVKGGVAWADTDYSATFAPIAGINVTATANDTRVGGLLGFGVEYGFLPNWSAKLEYNYVDFGDENLNFPISLNGAATGISANVDINQQIHTVKGGINYRFGGY